LQNEIFKKNNICSRCNKKCKEFLKINVRETEFKNNKFSYICCC